MPLRGASASVKSVPTKEIIFLIDSSVLQLTRKPSAFSADYPIFSKIFRFSPSSFADGVMIVLAWILMRRFSS